MAFEAGAAESGKDGGEQGAAARAGTCAGSRKSASRFHKSPWLQDLQHPHI